MKVDQKRPTPQRELANVPPTGGDWTLEYDDSVVIGGQIAFSPGSIGPDNVSPLERKANCRLMAASKRLLQEAQVLRCLATSPRFQSMTVADALAELALNGCGHDGGAAIALATGGAA